MLIPQYVGMVSPTPYTVVVLGFPNYGLYDNGFSKQSIRSAILVGGFNPSEQK
jgi:hypothetical protein